MEAPAHRELFSAVPHSVVFDRRISPTSRALYAIVAAHCFRDGGVCRVGHARLADELSGCSERTIQGYLGELVERGHIVRERPGLGRPNVYRLVERSGSLIGRHLPTGGEPRVRPDRKHRSAQIGSTVPLRSEPYFRPVKNPEQDPEELPAAAARAREVELSDEAKPLVHVWPADYGEPFPELTPALARDVNGTVAAVGYAAVVDAIGWGARNGGKPLASVLKAARRGPPARSELVGGLSRTRAAPAANGAGAAPGSIASLIVARRF